MKIIKVFVLLSDMFFSFMILFIPCFQTFDSEAECAFFSVAEEGLRQLLRLLIGDFVPILKQIR